MVNSPSLATAQKVVVRQAKTAALKGSFRFRFWQIAVKSSIVQGSLGVLLDFVGWFFAAEAKRVWSSVGFIFHGMQWMMCHVLLGSRRLLSG